MPKMLQVRNVPDETHALLKARAAEAGLSLSEFALRELERVAHRPSVGQVLRRAAARGGRLRPEHAADLIRAEREARDNLLAQRLGTDTQP